MMVENINKKVVSNGLTKKNVSVFQSETVRKINQLFNTNCDDVYGLMHLSLNPVRYTEFVIFGDDDLSRLLFARHPVCCLQGLFFFFFLE